jgi:cyclophilin family peptidyl-prolyl cis-trans isomerase
VSKAAKRERQRLNREARREAELAWMKRRRRLKAARNVGLLLLPLVVLFVVLQVVRDDDSTTAEPIKRNYDEAPPLTIDPNRTYQATIDTSEGQIVVDLDPTAAPQTVNSFVFLARNRFYDGLTIHRVAPDFVIQGGDPEGDGSGGPGYTLPDEPPPDGYRAGSVAMANSGPNTSGSQFFIVLSDAGAQQLGGPPYLYSDLGQVSSGLDVAQQIATFSDPSNPQDPAQQTPTKRITIEKIRIQEGEVGAPAPPTTAPAAPPSS